MEKGGLMEPEGYMRKALQLAQMAGAEGEVPVGCIIVWDGKIVGQGRNRREQNKNALCHAEIEAMDMACRTLGGWRLWKAQLYVTLEPCPMCAGAIFNARIPTVYYGASDPNLGACGGKFDLFATGLAPCPQVTGGLLAEESAALLRTFFRHLRKKI
ncbi:MAG: nucleoside deaminase [Oscillospiraceae bacterium]|nr:nucleoside deaminase [Oscillospiraceae bacterium]